MKRAMGLIVVLLVAGTAIWFGVGAILRDGRGGSDEGVGGTARVPKGLTRVTGYVGGEKLGFLSNEKVQQILRERYHLDLDYRKLGSIEMVSGDVNGQDFLWPSSQVAEELYVQRHGKPLKSELIFNSPIVLYTWDEIATALEGQSLISQGPQGNLTADLPGLVHAIDSGRTWQDVGLPSLYGRISIFSTDPTRSNSGNMFAGLLANIFNGGEVADEAVLPHVLPQVQSFFKRLGYLEGSSEDIFRHYLEQGMGAKPVIVGYESQLIEFSIEHPDYLDVLKQKVRIVYPQPTVWSNHPLIALTDGGVKLLEALQDKELQQLAWQEHGFRSGLAGTRNDPAVLDVIGIPQDITSVMPMPSASVMERLIAALGEGAAEGTPAQVHAPVEITQDVDGSTE